MKEVGEILDEIRKNKNEYNHNIMTDEVEILTKMVTSLEPYTKPGGQYFKYFNGVNNINLDSSFFTLELDDISSSPMMPVVAMSFLQRTAQEAFVGYLKDKSKARIIGVDEAHKILGNEIFAKFFDDFGRRIRKYRGIPMLITQSLEDFNVNQSAKIFFELASFKVLLRQKSESVEKATRQAYFQANAFQQKLINSINIKKPHYNEFYLRHNNLDMVLLLKVNADEYWTYTTDPLDRSKIDDVMNKYDISLLDALWVLARLSDGMDIDKALYELTKKAGRKGTKDWDEFFKYTIENKSVCIARQNVLHDNKKDIPKYQELFMRIKDKNGVLHNPGVFLQAAQEKEYYEEIGKLFLDNVCEYIIRDSVLNPELIYSINIDNFDIQSDSFIQNLFTVIGRLGKERNKLLLELKLDHLTKTNFDKVLSFARRAKKMGVLIGFDNVLLKQTDFYSLISLSPKLFKIDIQSLLEIDDFERKMLKNYIAVLVQAADISVIATKLEEDEQLEEAKTFGIDLFQGWLISKTENI
jgi:conjugal transfer ATP-binding protein TraC